MRAQTLFIAFALVASASRAAEVDSFTDRRALKDSAPALNTLVNAWMDEALVAANKPPLMGESPKCDPARLYEELEKKLGGFVVGHVEAAVNEDEAIDKIVVPYERSIYRDIDFRASPTVAMTHRLATLVRVGDVYLGTDKFGHFFSEGYTYFKLYKDAGPDAPLAFGELSETTFFGQMTTGVYSYADLTANLNGLRFWNAVLGEREDPFNQGKVQNPYVQCVDDRWQRVRDFDWRDYVDDAWDEAKNCNAVKSREFYDHLVPHIRALTGGKGCPIASLNAPALKKKYGGFFPFVCNTRGLVVREVPLRPRFDNYLNKVVKQRFERKLKHKLPLLKTLSPSGKAGAARTGSR